MKLVVLVVILGIPMLLEAISTYTAYQRLMGRPVGRFLSGGERLVVALAALLVAAVIYTML
ncbi:hypothetical protein N7414_09310 [Pseudomonas sp. GD04087]|uniref:hypothetical protein n=1 Tax=unclassified Pseudomonas TaxID=196821 RepID=UPI0024498FB2|nr:MULTISPECIES: hypothetical protein [unclassified Pseudomonas]MDH0289311.1 hypothetical protein [Pseudomonas sp. GD04087]MDH1052887.1 hypothetical protein [Pseudomonas sp. GD03903]MDH2002622.1 hypothetical protein [Pseudomonas sp. GD03691]